MHLQASILKQKTALQKHAVTLKTQQKDLQTVKLELGVFLSLWMMSIFDIDS